MKAVYPRGVDAAEISVKLTEDGRVEGVRFLASPNADGRPPGEAITLLVVHNISLPPGAFGGDAVHRLFTNALDPSEDPYFAALAATRVSAHFLVRRSGEIVQFVPCASRAWHAGVSHWEGRERCNDFSIGVELEGTDVVPYHYAQYRALATLISVCRAAYPLGAIVGHCDIAPGRKTDPGPAFDWTLLYALLARPV